MFNYEEEIENLDPGISKVIDKIVRDLNNIEEYRTLSLSPWKSNLPEILPFIGQRMESEIKTHLRGVEIQMQDLERRKKILNNLSFIKK